MEGVTPLIQTTNGFFIFSLQAKLFVVSTQKRLEIKLISDKNDGFAIDNAGVVFYKFVTDEKTEGYYLNFHNWLINKIDPSINAKIYNCEKSLLVTTTQKTKLIPCYIICGIPYVFSDKQWMVGTDFLLYSDKQLEIKLYQTANESKFSYKVLN